MLVEELICSCAFSDDRQSQATTSFSEPHSVAACGMVEVRGKNGDNPYLPLNIPSRFRTNASCLPLTDTCIAWLAPAIHPVPLLATNELRRAAARPNLWPCPPNHSRSLSSGAYETISRIWQTTTRKIFGCRSDREQRQEVDGGCKGLKMSWGSVVCFLQGWV